MSIEITKLLEERASLITNMQEAVAAEGDFGAEQRQEFDREQARVVEINSDVERLEKLKGLSEVRSIPAADVEARTAETSEVERRTEPLVATDEYRSAFDAVIRGRANDEQRSMVEGTSTAGGVLVPTTLHTEIVEFLANESGIRKVARIINTTQGNPLDIPRVTARGPASLVAETVAYPTNQKVLDKETLQAFKYGDIIRVSEELVQDAAYDINGWLAQNLAQIVAERENPDLTKGDGSSKPLGFTAATVGKTAATITAVTYAEIAATYASVKEAYRRNGSWLISDSLFAGLISLVDGQGRPLFIPSMAADQPDTLFGKPVFVESDMDAFATGKVAAVFGDFQRGYWIRDAGSFNVQVLREKYADTGEIGFKGWHRTDGSIIDTQALRSLKLP